MLWFCFNGIANYIPRRGNNPSQNMTYQFIIFPPTAVAATSCLNRSQTVSSSLYCSCYGQDVLYPNRFCLEATNQPSTNLYTYSVFCSNAFKLPHFLASFARSHRSRLFVMLLNFKRTACLPTRILRPPHSTGVLVAMARFSDHRRLCVIITIHYKFMKKVAHSLFTCCAVVVCLIENNFFWVFLSHSTRSVRVESTKKRPLMNSEGTEQRNP